MKKFIKYKVELCGVKEEPFVEMFNKKGEWEGIQREAEAYGIETFGVSRNDDMVICGTIIATTAQGCKGILSEMKAWLKSTYGCKKTSDLMIGSGNKLF